MCTQIPRSVSSFVGSSVQHQSGGAQVTLPCSSTASAALWSRLLNVNGTHLPLNPEGVPPEADSGFDLNAQSEGVATTAASPSARLRGTSQDGMHPVSQSLSRVMEAAASEEMNPEGSSNFLGGGTQAASGRAAAAMMMIGPRSQGLSISGGVEH